ncbi:MAG: mevalonate kinase [Candidatus Thermoplasmatota archaeon]
MSEGVGYGKVILFNEHFVVHGIPSLVSAISSATTAKVEPYHGSGWKMEDKRPETIGYKKEKLAQQRDSVERMLRAAGVDAKKTPIKIVLGGDLVAASGVGASAASCAAIARALSGHFNLHLTEERINELAYEGEKAYHGTPSGVDNTAATYGGLIWFVRKGGGNEIERIRMKKPVEIVMGNTGIVTDTKAAVAGVKERMGKEPGRYRRIFNDAEALVHEARRAIESYDLHRVGGYMDRNHEMLRNIGVSCKELEFLVELAREHGALGAKLTGGGLGGYMVALTPGKELQERVARAIEREHYRALRAMIGV